MKILSSFLILILFAKMDQIMQVLKNFAVQELYSELLLEGFIEVTLTLGFAILIGNHFICLLSDKVYPQNLSEPQVKIHSS
jgi:hypothetical protein